MSRANPPINATVAEIEQGDADLPAVPLQVHRQDLALQRVMDGLVAPLDLVPLQVDEHVRQAGDDPHEQRGQAAKDPRGRPRTSGHPARQEETDDDRQVDRPRSPREQTLPEQEARPDGPRDHEAEAPQDPADQPDLVQDAGRHHDPRQRRQQQVGGIGTFQPGDPGGGIH